MTEDEDVITGGRRQLIHLELSLSGKKQTWEFNVSAQPTKGKYSFLELSAINSSFIGNASHAVLLNGLFLNLGESSLYLSLNTRSG